MRLSPLIAVAALLVVACGRETAPEAPPRGENPVVAAPETAARQSEEARWDLQSSGEGVALALPSSPGRADIRLYCPAGQGRLLVNVPAFRPIGSEERLSFGGSGEVVALVADPRGDRRRGGVSATGEVPDNLAVLLRGPLSASYGAQSTGPHRPPPEALSRAFIAACNERAGAADAVEPPPTAAASACRIQDGETLRVAPLRALGTEPFWAARIDGRCVTYSHPEDQAGTRIWTRYTAAEGGGLWVGALAGRRFELRTRAQPGCSDGMSDRRYPIAVELLVDGERRRGCAAPA
jgi:uncharacterized membrane protein